MTDPTPDELAGTELTTISKPWACPDGRLVIGADAPRADWLAARQALVGASDVGKLIGASRWGNAYTVWADKTGQTPPSPTTSAQRRGQLFESAIVDLWAEHYAEFPIRTRRHGLVASRVYPHVGATVDRLSVCLLDGRPSRCVIEVKSQISMDEWADGEVPTEYQLQGMAQLLATGRDHVHYVGMGPRFVPEHRVIYRDEPLLQLIGETVERFWAEHVDAGVAPMPTAQDLDVVGRVLHRATAGKVCVIDDDLAPHVRALLDARAEVAAAQATANAAEAVVKTAMADATELQWPDGETVATWRPGKTIDGANATWRKANPELVAGFSVPVVGATELDVAKLVESHPEVLASGALRHRRSFKLGGA